RISASVDHGARSAETQEAQVVKTAHAIARWRAADDLIWTRYDDAEDWLVYNPASGDIHLLSDAGYRLWMLTTTRSTTLDQLVSALAHGSPPTEALAAAARESLAAMDRAGLIRIVSAS